MQLGITSLDGLKSAAEAGRLRDLSGMGARSEEKILKALEAGVGDKTDERRLLATALPAVRRVVAELEAHPAALAVSEAGSVRRRRETVRDLDLIATSGDPAALIDAFCDGDWVAEIVARGDTKATVVAHDALRFDLRVVPAECYGNVLQHFTGSKDHNIALREDAQRRGLSISEYGVTTVETGEVVTHASEDELYAYLGYHDIAPELREGTHEIAAAREGALPELVELADLRGEMHCHSTWSADGRASIEEMALTAKGRGYRYPVHHRPLALPPRRAARGAVGGDRRGERPPEVVSSAPWDRGEHPRRRLARRGRRLACAARLGRSPRCTRRSIEARPSASSA